MPLQERCQLTKTSIYPANIPYFKIGYYIPRKMMSLNSFRVNLTSNILEGNHHCFMYYIRAPFPKNYDFFIEINRFSEIKETGWALTETCTRFIYAINVTYNTACSTFPQGVYYTLITTSHSQMQLYGLSMKNFRQRSNI